MQRTARGGCVLAALVWVIAMPKAGDAQDTTRVRADSAQVAQDSLRPQPDSLRADSLTGPIDTATAAVLGLPTAPSRQFPQADSLIQALLERAGYRATRYASDTVRYEARTSEIRLRGAALVEREGTTLEADSIRFQQLACALSASGDPRLFESGTVLVGDDMSYDTCARQGLVREALTSFNQSGVDWYLRGGLGVDSAATRLYTGDGALTSCEDDAPHYHFEVGRMKWVTNNIMVARPAKLYVRDVPVMWLPFIFQDMRRGRRSGLLTPRFGISDLVRPNQGYRRNVTNIGYYFAINDYVDFQASLDWFAQTNVSVNGQLRYRWLDRFVTGGVSLSRIFESGAEGRPGRRSLRLAWNHQQSFDQQTRLSANVDFATSSSVIQQNSIDPFLQTATLRSTINFSKQFDWGTLTLGGSRSQNLSDDVVQQTFPDVRLTPSPISLGPSVTWSPSFSFTTNQTLNQFQDTLTVAPITGIPLTADEQAAVDTIFRDTRRTNLRFQTPIRVGSWTWQNSFDVRDNREQGRFVEMLTDPNDPMGSLNRVYSEDFSTEVDWNTGINLPMLFPSSWKLQPSLGIQNATSGAFMVRNRNTGGTFVQQGKRFSLSASVSPSIFGFFPGLGPLERIRHAVSPQVSWSYAPSARVNEEYARALNPNATELRLESNPLHAIRFGLSQTFEGKFAMPEGDSVDTRDARKVKILNVQTTAIEYDFEQAKEEGRNGWKTQTLSNSFSSDLLRGFQFRITHDLWNGPVGFDTTAFDPFLTSVSARFSISGRTVGRLFQALFGGQPLEAPTGDGPIDSDLDSAVTDPGFRRSMVGRGTSFPTADAMAGPTRGQGFTASLSYNDQRSRPQEGQTASSGFAQSRDNRTMDVSMAFSPTRAWSLSWTTQYNFTNSEFGQHVLRFDRDLHRWRATFSVVRAPNGNFAFSFFINLIDQPEIRFNYDQRSVN